MCYNCGCGVPNDDMGRGKVTDGGASITEDDLKVLSQKWDMSLAETKKNILELLKQEVES